MELVEQKLEKSVKEKIDKVVEEYQGYILVELKRGEKSDEDKIACYFQSIIVINNIFDTNYSTNLDHYEKMAKSFD